MQQILLYRLYYYDFDDIFTTITKKQVFFLIMSTLHR